MEITEQKKAEERIKDLLEQLEIEKKYAQMNSVTDGLTRINNRRYFDDILRREFYNLKRNGLPLSMILMDIDYFKKYNDSYGHQGGDECLKSVAQAVKNSIHRETDTVARYGGEEFAVILPCIMKCSQFATASNFLYNLHRRCGLVWSPIALTISLRL